MGCPHREGTLPPPGWRRVRHSAGWGRRPAACAQCDIERSPPPHHRWLALPGSDVRRTHGGGAGGPRAVLHSLLGHPLHRALGPEYPWRSARPRCSGKRR
eukprot:9651247-Alexandrium_andersonii.AAC.1